MSEIETVGNVQELVESAQVEVEIQIETESSETSPEKSPETAQQIVEGLTELKEDLQSNGPKSEAFQDPDIISDGVAEFEKERATLEHKIANVSIELLETSDRAKGLKKFRDVLTDQLMELIANGPEPIRRAKPPVSNSQPTITTTVDGSELSEDQQAEQQQHQLIESNEWRSVSISELCLSKGVNTKLEESNVNTIGDLVDLISEISNHRKEWPKGIGQAKITAIEDSLSVWLTKNRDKDLFGPVAQSTQVVNESLDQSPDVIPTISEWEEMTDAQRSMYINNLACKMMEVVECGGTILHETIPQWKSGFDAYGDGAAIDECPYVPGDEMDAWLRGFLFADIENNQNETNQEQSDSVETDEQDPTSESTPESEQIDIDDM